MNSFHELKTRILNNIERNEDNLRNLRAQLAQLERAEHLERQATLDLTSETKPTAKPKG